MAASPVAFGTTADSVPIVLADLLGTVKGTWSAMDTSFSVPPLLRRQNGRRSKRAGRIDCHDALARALSSKGNKEEA